MKSTSILAIIVALLATASAVVVTLNSEDVSADDSVTEYAITYFGELEGETVINEVKYYEAGKTVVIWAPPADQYGDYQLKCWTCNGDEYAVGDEFVMPESDVKFEAEWNFAVNLASEVKLTEDVSVSSVDLIVGTIIAILSIVGIVFLLQKKRINPS